MEKNTRKNKEKNVYVCVCIYIYTHTCMCVYTHIHGFPGGPDGKDPTCNAGNPGLIPGSGRFQYSCLENSMHRGD